MPRTVGDGLRYPGHPGHFSGGSIAGGFLFVSGQPPTDLATGEVVPGDCLAQARQCLRNVETVVKLAGGTLDDVVKTTAWLHDWSDYDVFNQAYGEVFPTDPPARSTVQGTRPPGQRVAIEAHRGNRGMRRGPPAARSAPPETPRRKRG